MINNVFVEPRVNRRAQDSLDTISTARLGLGKKKSQDDHKELITDNDDWADDHLL